MQICLTRPTFWGQQNHHSFWHQRTAIWESKLPILRSPNHGNPTKTLRNSNQCRNWLSRQGLNCDLGHGRIHFSAEVLWPFQDALYGFQGCLLCHRSNWWGQRAQQAPFPPRAHEKSYCISCWNNGRYNVPTTSFVPAWFISLCWCSHPRGEWTFLLQQLGTY